MWVKKCRVCGGELKAVLSLGKIPMVNTFPRVGQGRVTKYPLDLGICKDCGLAQLRYLLNPEKLFANYHYISGASGGLREHLKSLASGCIAEFGLTKKSQVLDIGCNDGTFLAAVKGRVKAIGVDPSRFAIKRARDKDIEVIMSYFGTRTARKLINKFGKFDLVVVTHTLACVRDLIDFGKGIESVLTDEGVAIIEVGDFPKMVKQGSFDALYHEHYSYFGKSSLEQLMKKCGLTVFRIEENQFHGGSLRVYVSKKNERFALKIEDDRPGKSELSKFAKQTSLFRVKIKKIFEKLVGKKIAIYGIPAKGVTLLNYCGLGAKEIGMVVDSTTEKQGRLVPGKSLVVSSESELVAYQPEAVLVLAWNYLPEILKKLNKELDGATKVIVPFPKLRVTRLDKLLASIDTK